MLHRINLPDCEAELNAILVFQRKVLAFACNPQTELPLMEEKISGVFDEEQARWLWRRLSVHKKDGSIEKSSIHKHLESLIQFLHNRSDGDNLGQRIIAAFEHDINFQDHIDDEQFEFHFIVQLSEDEQKAVRPLMEDFYTELLASSGFPTCIHNQKKTFNRDRFVERFWCGNSSVEVCPACDAPRSDKIDLKVYDDADHFLPKSKYPFLSVHRSNLVPICVYCNRAFKGEFDPVEPLGQQVVGLSRMRDPLDGPDNIYLSNSYHPYYNPAIDQISILVERNQGGVQLVDILDGERQNSHQVASFKRVLRLHKRWQDRLRYQVETIRDEVADMGSRFARHSILPDIEEFREELRDMLKERQGRIGRRHWYVLQHTYLQFVLEDEDEFQELYAQFCGA